jgi:signal transduction histidine kinase/CheY-like chemotaxis protein
MIDCNQEVVKIFGIPDKEFFLTRHPELFPEYQPSGELSAEVSAQNVRIAMEKGYHHFECMHRKFTGTPLPVESTLVRVKYKGNYVIAAYFRDLTEQKAMAQLEKQHAQAEAANHAKSAFLATMSHEMRTPMNAILGITEIILRNETLPSNLQESLYKIYDSSNLLLNIINDILDLSKIEAGKLEILPARYETASMINDTVTLNVMRIGSKPIEFRLSVDENLPAYLFGDELRIRQILNNVLSNAIKYTPKGEVKLSVFAEKENETVLTSEGTVSTEGLNLLCIVSDTGQGMSKEQVSSLFDEYSRFNTKANRTTEGTGLGMSITYNLVRMMNGHISVESELDKGTIVTVRLPQGNVSAGVIGRELAENLAKFEKSAIKQIKKAQIDYDLMPYGSVLLVDDVESNIFVARGLMFPYELSIESVLSGFEAIEKIREGKTYDIVFMDHMMPRMDGIETTQKLREMGYAQPIVALTANAIVGQSNIFMENGFDGFISKPIDIRQLNAMLKKFIRDKQPPEVIEAANRNKVNQVNLTNEIEHMGINPKLEEIFIRDASRLAKTLEEIQKNGIYEDEDIRLYIVSVHALKSALANVHEMNLSELAFMLEKAGREKNTAVMSAETKSFLDSLWAVIKKHTLHKEHSEGEETVNQQIIVEDRAYLQEKLQVIKNACEVYDRKAIKAAIADLQEKEWNALTKKLIATMDEELLNGDFEAIAKRAEEGVGMKNEK